MNRIRDLRKQMNMTQKELAKYLQVADSTLSYWEMGKYEPDTEALMKLSRFFKVPIDYILGGDFARWYLNEESVPSPGIGAVGINDNDTSVSESSTSYTKSTSTKNLRDTPSAFNRAEFDGLTQSEIDLLAEYAEFIKSRRKSDLSK